jgi:hypothetical protein
MFPVTCWYGSFFFVCGTDAQNLPTTFSCGQISTHAHTQTHQNSTLLLPVSCHRPNSVHPKTWHLLPVLASMYPWLFQQSASTVVDFLDSIWISVSTLSDYTSKFKCLIWAHSFFKVLAVIFYDIYKEGNHILGKERVLLFVTIRQ